MPIGYQLRSIGGGIKKYAVHKVGATTYYVDGTNGNDNNDGLSWRSAKKTIQAAVNEAESWGVIYIKSGTYNESVYVDEPNISLIGESKYNTVIKSPGGYALGTVKSNLVVCNLKCIGYGYTGPAAGITTNAKNIKIINCIVGNQDSGGYGITCDQDFIEIDHLQIDQTYVPGIGIGCLSDYVTVRNCKISGPDVGIYLADSKYSIVCDNHVSDCDVATISSDATSTNNIITHNNLIYKTGATQNVKSYNSSTVYIENYYSDHTNIDNGFGICTEPYFFSIDQYDIRPVPYYNGWKSLSIQRTLLRKNTYGYETNATGVTFSGTTWVDLFSKTVTVDTKLTGIKMTTSGTFAGTPKYRIIRDGSKVFPYNSENPIESGVLREFDEPINIPIGSSYKVQIRSTDAGDTTQTVVLDELDKIEVV